MEVSINKKEKIDETDNYYNLIESEYMEDLEVINKYLEQETFFKKEIRKQNKKKQMVTGQSSCYETWCKNISRELK